MKDRQMEVLTFLKGTAHQNSWEFNQLKVKAIYSVVFSSEQDDLLPVDMQKLFYCVLSVIFKSNLKTNRGVIVQNVSVHLPSICTDISFQGRRKAPV